MTQTPADDDFGTGVESDPFTSVAGQQGIQQPSGERGPERGPELGQERGPRRGRRRGRRAPDLLEIRLNRTVNRHLPSLANAIDSLDSNRRQFQIIRTNLIELLLTPENSNDNAGLAGRCVASIDAGLGVHLEVAQELAVPTIQVHAPHAGTRTPQAAQAFLSRCKAAGITITAVFGGFEGESYADIATTARTVGLVPRKTRAARLQEMKEISDFTKLLGCPTVALHIGFVPHDTSSADYHDLLATTRDLLDHVAANGQQLNLETGQESADHLLQFISDVQRDNLFINFDPANMILYGTGEPIEALKKVGRYVRSVHCKDARWAASEVRGTAWARKCRWVTVTSVWNATCKRSSKSATPDRSPSNAKFRRTETVRRRTSVTQ
ncbi:MAG UNVERIFIED_CONTAM: sugar phosphate isomerase/epimerase [Planctomycetaceae bacterium]|jgi:sugar phosphate isomerase/epimerase